MTQRTNEELLKENLELRNMVTVARDAIKRLTAENEALRDGLKWTGSCALETLEKYPRQNEPPPRSSKVVPIRPTNGSAP